jgi:lysophospholipase L1-like esterase
MVNHRRSLKRASARGVVAALFFAFTLAPASTTPALASICHRASPQIGTQQASFPDDTTSTSTQKTSKTAKTAKTKKTAKTSKPVTTANKGTTRKKTTTANASKAPARKTTMARARPQPKPWKPVPLTPINPVPIEMGDGNPLDTFFHALADLESPPADAPAPPVVHIIHFGDSHVASDYWAGVLREDLQARFGDAGPGFVLPGRPWSTIRYVEAKSLDGVGWRTDGLRLGETDGVVGLGGMSMESYRPANPATALASFSQFEVFSATTPGGDCLQIELDGASAGELVAESTPVIGTAPPSEPDNRVPEPSPQSLGGGAAAPPDPPAPLVPVKRKRVRRYSPPPVPPYQPWPPDSPMELLRLSNATPLATGMHRISIRSTCGSKARLLGLELNSGAKGVLYDTDGVNGARLTDLEKPLPALRKALLREAHPALIIVSYGTNDIGAKGFTASGYEESAFQILSRLKEDSGEASILVTGPTDRGNPRRRMRLFLQAAQAELQPALRRAALRAGCAYWDQQAAMGGRGAIARWVRAGLAQYDYVHFTSPGYKKLADLLFAQIMAEYSKFQKAQAGQ